MSSAVERAEPNGCRWCGIPQRPHARQQTAAGAHTCTPPTDAQRLARMTARRAQHTNPKEQQ